MSDISIICTPPGGSPEDITGDCVFTQCSFESLFNGQPGSFDIRVRDPLQTHSFATGDEIKLTIDGTVMQGGYVTSVGMTSFAPAADIPADPADYDMRVWHLTGADYNIVLDRRVFRRTSNYLTSIVVNQTVDGAILRAAIAGFTDMSDFDTSGIDDVATIPDITHVTIQQGWYVRKEFEILLPFSGAVYYIDGDKKIIWKAYDNAEKRWGFSDVPNYTPITDSPDEYQGALYGFSQVEATEDGTMLANDVFVWGGSALDTPSGGTVFHRSQDSTSQDDHGVWQHSETHFGEEMFKSNAGVTAVADAILNGPPGTDATGQEKGLKNAQWQFTFTWFSNRVPELDGVRDHIKAGDLVTVNLQTFDVTRLLPVRSLRISFPDALEDDGTHLVQFDGTFGLQLSDSFTLWRYIIQNQNRVVIQTPLVVGNDSDNSQFGGYYGGGTVLPAPDGTTTTFSLPFGYILGTTQVWINGLQQARGVDYAESDNEAGLITFTSAPLSTDTIRASAYTLTSSSSATIPADAYYISPTGDDSTGDGSAGNPWQTIRAFADVAAPGNTLLCRGGDYTGVPRLILSSGDTAGTPGNPITVRNYPGETPVFHGAGTGSNSQFVMVTDGVNYWTFDGLTAVDFKVGSSGVFYVGRNVGLTVPTTHIVIRNCTVVMVHEGGGPFNHCVYLSAYAEDCVIEYNRFIGAQVAGSDGEGCNIGDHEPSPQRTLIQHNIFSNFGNAGAIWWNGDLNTGAIIHNTFLNPAVIYISLRYYVSVTVQDNAGETASSHNIDDVNDSGHGVSTIDHNFFAQTFASNYLLLPGNTGIKAATDGTDAGALNS